MPAKESRGVTAAIRKLLSGFKGDSTPQERLRRRMFLARTSQVGLAILVSPFIKIREALASYYNLGAFWRKSTASSGSGGGGTGPGSNQPAKMFVWGGNSSGSLGLGDINNRSNPVQLGTANTWTRIWGGSYSAFGRMSDGSLWSWGYNNSGVLGQNNATNYSSPVIIGAAGPWTNQFAAYYHAAAIQTDGSLWVWGMNVSGGALGLGDTADRSSPVKLGTTTDWSSIAVGRNFNLAIKTNGALWTWGYNANGQLGVGDTANRSSPVQVGATLDWKYVAAGAFSSFAIKTNGTLWSWGGDGNGVLGHGTSATPTSSPVQVGSATDWAMVSTEQSSALGVKTGGTLWAWGLNTSYQLGLGDVNGRSLPTQVGTDTDWAVAAMASAHVVAIKTGGTLWAWGDNAAGEIGTNDITVRSVPTQVGTAATWINLCGSVLDDSFATST